MVIAKIEDALPEEIRTIKNNSPEPIKLDWDIKPVINFLEPEEFYKHYQNLALTREEQEQWLAQLNTRLYCYCLILSNFEYCDDCNLIYNPLPCMIYMISEKKKPISSCTSESELPFDPDSNSDNNDDKNNALEIPTTTMVLLASRSSLAKKRINIKGGIVDAEYTENISAMLQNNSEKAYIIEPNEKIAQAIFLPLVKIASLVEVGTREELGITARRIQGFGSMGRIEVLVNMAEEEIVGQGEIISTGQAISIPPYSQYMLAIEKKEKEQEQIFEAEANLCESEEIELINLHILAKSYSCIKILIYNYTGKVINIPEGITIRYLITKIEDQQPNPIPDFPQLCAYVDIISQTIYG
ncbi:hypothetical protein G9A89_018436 [Geosiphon pyriformis]|nr:hypothetical protein G9A89_018436 [Geosiphon pyriformis]